MNINSKTGIDGEEFVNNIAYSSLLKYWCYPNPIDELGTKKEICDLLILFNEVCIIISVKAYNLKGNYERYKKRVVDKSTKQLLGAYRKLFILNKEIHIKHPDRDIEKFNPDEYSEIFLITVNVGEQFEEYEIVDLIPEKGDVVIFNRETFVNVLKELDTIKDLVEYLRARKNLFSAFETINLVGKESDLLATYMLNVRSIPIDLNTHHTELTLDISGQWETYDAENIHVRDRREADKISYFIDELCEKDVLKLPWGEKLAKILLSSSRLERRATSQSLHQMYTANEGKTNFLHRRHFAVGSNLYLLIYYSKDTPEEVINETLGLVGAIYMHMSEYVYDNVVILGGSTIGKEYKFGLYENTGRPQPTDIALIESWIEGLEWFRNTNFLIHNVKEFPNESD